MVNNTQIKECFDGLVGFKQPYDPAYPTLSSIATASSSGIFIDNVHPLCSIENLVNIAPNFKNFTYNFPAWVSGANYAKGAKVSSSSVNYIAKNAITNSLTAPGADTTNWRVFEPFSEWLHDVLLEASSSFVNELLTLKKYLGNSRTFVDSMNLYQGVGALVNKIVKKGRFVGVEIVPNKQEGMIFRIDAIGFQTDTTQEELTFYLYHSSISEPLKEIVVSNVSAGSFGWYEVTDVILDANAFVNDSNGVFWLGYYEEDVVGQAIYREMNFMRPCSGCSGYNMESFNLWSKYVKISAFETAENTLDEERDLFDYAGVISVPVHNFGMNLKVSVLCDLTRLVCRNKSALAEAYSQKVALDFITRIAFNTRLGGISDKTKQLAMVELGEDPSSFASMYKKTMQAANLDFAGTSSVCLPCGDDHLRISRKAI